MGRIFLEHLGGTRLFSCANCDTVLTNKEHLISTRFTGATGRAFLFHKVVNLKYSEVQDRVMLTGRHMVRDVSCKNCDAKLGWIYEFATEEDQRYKRNNKHMDLQNLLNDGGEFASKAVAHDNAGEHKLARFFYVEASESLLKAISMDSSLSEARTKVMQYMNRAESLMSMVNTNQILRSTSQSSEQKDIAQVEFLLSQAVSEDETGNTEAALPLYTDVIEHCLEKSRSVTDAQLKAKLNRWAKGAIERAEALKGIKQLPAESVTPDLLPTKLTNSLSLKSKSDQKGRLTASEIETLKHTSYVNNKIYPPLLDVDLNERFAYRIPFSDPSGLLSLAPQQQKRFGGWVRPSDLCENPHMIYAISCFSIKQTIVTDCSFVASLAISAAYERQFQKKLITSIIYPQKRDGTPMMNPCGKYMVKLRFNGVARKVVIDDQLPVDKNGQLLCSYSQNRDEFWVSLLEKAYMKVMGGYNFPGSNSNNDLNALTGWIPERSSLKSKDVNHDVLFDRLVSGLEKGDALITAATGNLSDVDADRAGLVPTHAYAVLNMKHVLGKRLCLLKNPWSHLRWKGNYSETDTVNWTPELQSALGYNRAKATQNDNGVFWINWESVRKFFDVFYMNWNPKLFPYKYTLHSSWRAAKGPVKDAYNIGDNPQYRLETQSENKNDIVWILLTRHITQIDDFADNKEFITLHIYKTDGKRVYYPDNKHLEGTKINSPHYLAKLNPGYGQSRFTIAVSQYEKLNTIYYSLKIYSTAKFSMAPVPELYSSKKRITVNWTKSTSGGPTHSSHYESNPKIPLELIANGPSNILIKLEVSRQYAAAIELRSDDKSYTKNSGSYRWGFVAFALEAVPPGHYLIIPSTYIENQEGPFFIEVQASCAFKLNSK